MLGKVCGVGDLRWKYAWFANGVMNAETQRRREENAGKSGNGQLAQASVSLAASRATYSIASARLMAVKSEATTSSLTAPDVGIAGKRSQIVRQPAVFPAANIARGRRLSASYALNRHPGHGRREKDHSGFGLAQIAVDPIALHDRLRVERAKLLAIYPRLQIDA